MHDAKACGRHCKTTKGKRPKIAFLTLHDTTRPDTTTGYLRNHVAIGTGSSGLRDIGVDRGGWVACWRSRSGCSLWDSNNARDEGEEEGGSDEGGHDGGRG